MKALSVLMYCCNLKLPEVSVLMYFCNLKYPESYKSFAISCDSTLVA